MKAANALVNSQLYYCNFLFKGPSDFKVRKLPCIKNSLARIITNTTRYSDITTIRKTLHWLPVQQWSVFKTTTIVYTFL